ncbi:MAG TPA: hypothetical protein VFC78_14835 [Tepidisphaeraceae bacterium]|nr:hypothetical protein [Tepidisphaeraceae bacterium]
MLRRAFALMSIVSLALLILCAALWIWSYRSHSAYPVWTSEGLWEVSAREGRIAIDNEPQRGLDRAPFRAVTRFREQQRELRIMHSKRYAALREQWENRPNHLNEIDDTVREMAVESRKAQDAEYRILPIMSRAKWPRWPITPRASYSVRYSLIFRATSVLPVLWLASIFRQARRRQRQIDNQICTACGYDLRATPLRCPECGAASQDSDP